MNENSSSCFKVMTDTDRDHLIGNIVAHLGGAHKRIQLRQTALFFKDDPDYDTHVAKGLGLDQKEVERLAVLSQDERVKAISSSLDKPKSERKGEQR
jgi:catalase